KKNHTGVKKNSHPMSYKPLLLLDFFTFLFSLLYIELKVPQGTGRIFEQTTLKNLHLHNKKGGSFILT
ncbi:TPA: hypothetical protein ACGW47_005746, partial [Bacillus paranthracis]